MVGHVGKQWIAGAGPLVFALLGWMHMDGWMDAHLCAMSLLLMDLGLDHHGGLDQPACRLAAGWDLCAWVLGCAGCGLSPLSRGRKHVLL
jgi:hypothetical protein